MKTQKTDASVADFIAQQPEAVQAECGILLEMMEKASGGKGAMWGDSIVGFGDWRYKYASGKEGDWFYIGFSPRKANMTVYMCQGYGYMTESLAKLGKHKTGMGCLYVRRLSDIDIDVLKGMIDQAMEAARK